MWMRYWGLAKDPFAGLDTPYVPTTSHDEAVARLVHTIETAQTRAVLMAAAGLGKTTVLRQALAATSTPMRRFATVSCPSDGTLLFGLLAEGLGERIGREPSRLGAWRALERAIRLAALQGFHVVLAIDSCDERTLRAVQCDIDSLIGLRSSTNAELTLIQVGGSKAFDSPAVISSCPLVVELQPLTRSEAERYLTAKLKLAECDVPIFTPRAITRLHGLSVGVPRDLEQLTQLCLMAGAVRGLEVIPPDVVDGAANSYWNGMHPVLH
jgi:hypothetical protein